MVDFKGSGEGAHRSVPRDPSPLPALDMSLRQTLNAQNVSPGNPGCQAGTSGIPLVVL